MTLCIAWRNGKSIAFSSDSRLTLGDQYADIGIKVMAIPVEIEDEREKLIYNHRIAICFCGNSPTSLLIKESITDLLRKLQFLPIKGGLSFETIVSFVAEIAKRTSNSSIRLGADKKAPTVDFLLGGYCPAKNQIVVYQVDLVDDGEVVEAHQKEVLKNDYEYVLLGSGTKAAKAILERGTIQPGTDLLGVLRRVCNDNAVTSVGGHIQFAETVGTEFEVVGIQDFRVLENNTPELVLSYRGTEFYREDIKLSNGELAVTGRYLHPFESEYQEQWKKASE